MIHPYDPQAAMAAKYEAFARKNAATARRLGPSPWRDDWMPAKETPMDAPEPTNQAMAAASRAFDAGAEVYISGGTTRIEFTEDVFERWYLAEVAAARAPQAATATNGARDDAGSAHGGDGAAAGHTALRDRIRDAFHTITPDCVAYHATDCIDCTMRADTVMAEMRAEAAKERLNDIREEGRDL